MAVDNQTFWDQATGRPMSGLLLGTGKQPSFLASQDEGGGSKATMWGKQYQQGVNPNWQTGGKAPVQVGDENSIGFQSASAKKAMDLLRAKKGLPPLTPAAPTYQYADPMAAYRASLDPSMAFLMDATVANKNYGAKNNAGGNVDALMAEMNRYASQGMNFGNASGNSAKQIQRMAGDLARYGVNSLSELKAYEVPNPTGKGTQQVFYNTRTGAIIPTQFGSSMKGEGGSTYGLKLINGQIVPVPKWKDTSEASTYAPLAMAAGIAAPMILGPMAASGLGLASGSLGSAAVNAGISGLTSGALSAVGGGNFGKGFLTGALGSGIGSGISALNPGGYLANSIAPLGNTAKEAMLNSMVSGGVNRALSGGLGAGAGALINSGDAGSAALRGALSGGIAGLTSGALADTLGSGLSNTLGGQLGKFATSSLMGSPSGGMPSGGLSQAQQAQQANAARRQFRISSLPEYAQQRVRGGLDKLQGFGADFSDVDFI